MIDKNNVSFQIQRFLSARKLHFAITKINYIYIVENGKT